MIFFAVYIAINLLFLLWIWIKYKMNEVNTVRGFVAHCVRICDDIRTELLIPYGLFVVNTDEAVYNTANMVFEIAYTEFPPESGWNIQILSSDETQYVRTVKSMNEAVS